VLQHGATDELLEAKDAEFALDGVDITRSSNNISDVISGVTINLLKDSGAPTTGFEVITDVAGIKQNVETFVNQYNQLSRTIADMSAFDPVTLSSGPLFGDVTVQNVLNSVTDILTGAVSGLTGTRTLLSHIGITLDKTNLLNINDSELTAALTSDLSAVSKIFKATGAATDSAVSFVSSTQKTKASTSSGYAIDVTQAPTQGSVTGPIQHTANDNPDSEVLTFAGGQFPSGGITIAINPNSTIADIVAQINADKNISPIVTAANVGGFLQLTAKQYGSAYSFTAHSSQAAAANNSGIGIDTLIATGLDIVGTINGEAATGKGQFLTGNDGNATTHGLQIRVTSSTIGSKGTITYTSGLASQAFFYSQGASDALTGSLTQYSSSLGAEIDDMSASIKDLQAHVKEKEQQLRLRFAAMEAAVVRIKAAGNGLAGLTASLR
jgi:flagellar hook-associated protein 2